MHFFFRYAIPPEHGRRFERVANSFFPADFSACPAYLRHKMSVISPQLLAKNSIPYDKVIDSLYEMLLKYFICFYIFILDNTRKRRVYNNFPLWISRWI